MYHNFVLQDKLSKLIVEKCSFISEYTYHNFPKECTIKLDPNIVKEHFFAKYVYFSEIFEECFFEKPENISTTINLLCTAGYFYWVHLILCDEIFDNDIEDIKELNKKIIESNLYQEESIKIFSSIFNPLTSKFWESWGVHRNSFNYSINLNKLHYEELTLEIYENICDGKTAYGKAAIDAMYLLSTNKNKRVYDCLLTSYRFFSIGVQLIDDYKDIYHDIKLKQANYAVKELINLLTLKGLEVHLLSEKDIKKYFYMYVADDVLNLALGYFDKASNEINGFSNTDFWASHIDLAKRMTRYMESSLKEYKKLVLSRTLSQKHTIYGDKESITKAVSFILRSQNENGSWQEVFGNMRISDVWATSFIILNLSDLDFPILKQSISKACKFLIDNKVDPFSWGYNSVEVIDTDSTTCALIALMNNNFDVKLEHDKWTNFRLKNGGFSTYTDYGSIARGLNFLFRDLSGWMQNHNCVTVLAYYYLNKFYPVEKLTSEVGDFLLKSNLDSANSSFQSYWFTSSIYSIYFLSKTLTNGLSVFSHEMIMNITKEYSLNQNEDGSFSNEYGEPNVFFTSMMLDIYCSLLCAELNDYAHKAYKWLKSQQFEDGSFNSSLLLRIPRPDIVDVTKAEYGKTNQSNNLITKDYMRLFSTTMALKAISSYTSQPNE